MIIIICGAGHRHAETAYSVVCFIPTPRVCDWRSGWKTALFFELRILILGSPQCHYTSYTFIMFSRWHARYMYLFFNRVLFTRWPTSIYWQLKTKRIISQSNKINSVNDLCYYFRFAAKLIIDGIKSLLGNWYTFNIAYDFCWNW